MSVINGDEQHNLLLLLLRVIYLSIKHSISGTGNIIDIMYLYILLFFYKKYL